MACAGYRFFRNYKYKYDTKNIKCEAQNMMATSTEHS